MIGNKNQASKKYIVEYSMIKSILIPFAEIAFFFILIIILYLILTVFLGNRFFSGTYIFFVYLFSIVAILSLLRSGINYYRQRGKCKAFQIQVNGTDILLEDSLKKGKLKFHFNDIRKYTIINCGYSIHEVIKLEIKDSKKILIYSLMKNYRQFKKQLKNAKILGTDYKYKSLGYTEENMY